MFINHDKEIFGVTMAWWKRLWSWIAFSTKVWAWWQITRHVHAFSFKTVQKTKYNIRLRQRCTTCDCTAACGLR